MTSPIRVAVAGIGGRMGRQVAGAVLADPATSLVGGTVRPGSPLEGRDVGQIAGGAAVGVVASPNIADTVGNADILIDFTTPAATLEHARAARAAGKPVVVGTTGLSPDDQAELRELATATPIFFAANMSLGVNLLVQILPQIARALAADYDVEIVEAHHRHKKDAPSGTALRLAEAVAGALERDLRQVAVHGREGLAPRKATDIGIHAVRAGGIVGEHSVIFASEGEQIEVRHRAYSRQTFAQGAIRAAKFLVGRPPGLYSMNDLLAE